MTSLIHRFKNATYRLVAGFTHMFTGLLAAFLLALWWSTHAQLFLAYALLLELFFHVYELVEWIIVRDLVYKQLLENYLGFSAGAVLVTLAYLVGGVYACVF